MTAVAWVLDLDGVIWLADDVIPGAPEALERLRCEDGPLAFVTNNSFARRADVGAKLSRMGIDPGDDVVTSAAAAATLLEPGETVLVCGGPGVVEAVEGRGCHIVHAGDAPDAVDVVIVGYNPAFDYTLLTTATTAIRSGARFVATNDDATYPTPRGPIPGTGALVAAIVTASGVRPVVAGKPYEAMAALVRSRCGPSGIVVGDRPDTDGRFARVLDYQFGLVLSGVTTGADLPVEPSPDLVADSLLALVDAALP
jgi:HAD superfamily hydrolase (TIGR01450 family)